jgi:hypothetical protein
MEVKNRTLKKLIEKFSENLKMLEFSKILNNFDEIDHNLEYFNHKLKICSIS